MIEINMSLVHQYNYNLGLYKRSIFRAYFFRFSLSTNMYNLWARNTWIEIWIDIRWEEIYMEEDRDVTNFFRSFVKFLYFLASSNQRWECSLTWRTDRKGEHRTLVSTNLHPASGNSMELCSKPGSKRRRDLPKGRRPQIPTPRHPPSSSCFPAICKVACAQRRPFAELSTPNTEQENFRVFLGSVNFRFTRVDHVSLNPSNLRI